MTNPYVQALDELGAVMSRLDNHAVEHACRLVEEAEEMGPIRQATRYK